MAKKQHDQWEIMTNVLIDSGKYFDMSTCSFNDELEAVDLCQRNPMISLKISEWLSKLNKTRVRTLKLTNNYRTKGNDFFNEINSQNDLAADFYTKAIFSAPKDSVELALAHANRAACSVTSERFFEEGYFDCKMALRFNYPKKKLRKLFERKQYLADQTDKSEEYNAETYQEMKNMNIQLDSGRTFEPDEYQSKVRKNEYEGHDDKQPNPNFKLVERNEPNIRSGLVTPEAIKENQLVYCEKVFSFVPRYKFDHTDFIFYSCQCCGKINCLPFPCYNCARASYCSPTCLVNHEPIHKYECVGYIKHLWIQVPDGHLAFRTFLVGFKDAVEKVIERKKSTVREVWSSLMSNTNFAYSDVLRMVSHIDRIELKEALRFALTAQMLTIYLLEYTDFFDRLADEYMEKLDLNDWKKLVTAILMRHMAQVKFNGNSTLRIDLKPPSLYKSNYGYGSNSIDLDDLHLVISGNPFFVAFFPTSSNINHSCDPNIRFSMDGLHLSVYAIRDIGENEEIFTCYGPNYKLSSKADRQTYIMEKYFFECKCIMCQSDDETFNKYFAYYCPNEECTSLVDLDGVDIRWWLRSENSEYSKKISQKFFCDKCYTPLSMNPKKMQKFVQAAEGSITNENQLTANSADQDKITATLLDYYFSSSKCLGKHHELKSRLAHTILGFKILESNEKFFPKLAYITMEMYVNGIERFGQFSLAFIFATANALVILKMAKKIEQTNTSAEMARDIAKIRKILDINIIEKTFIMLPHSMQMIFRNSIRDNFVDDVNELGMIDTAFSNTFNLSDTLHFSGNSACDHEKSFG